MAGPGLFLSGDPSGLDGRMYVRMQDECVLIAVSVEASPRLYGSFVSRLFDALVVVRTDV
jgi:hypothetical protein